MREYAAGPGQVLVVYDTDDSTKTSGHGLSPEFLAAVSADIGNRAAAGWVVVTYDTTSRSMTRGDVLSMPHLWDAAITVIYRYRG